MQSLLRSVAPFEFYLWLPMLSEAFKITGVLQWERNDLFQVHSFVQHTTDALFKKGMQAEDCFDKF